MTTLRWEQAPMNVTRRVAMKAGLGTALSALSLSALRADDLPHHRNEGSLPMSHHLDTPLAAQNGAHDGRFDTCGLEFAAAQLKSTEASDPPVANC
jgi:hypothetical protein